MMLPMAATPTIVESLAGWLASWISSSPDAVRFVAAALHIGLLAAFFGLPAFAFIWAERKVSARIQDRLGPTHTGGRFGWLQSLADGIKLIQKEDLAPAAADRMLFRVSPYLVVIASFASFLFMPFSNGWVAVALDCGLFIGMAVLSLEVLGVVLAGYSSGSKWSLFGGMRETAQMVSYEVPLGLTAVIPVLICGTMNLNEICQMQSGWFTNWLVFLRVLRRDVGQQQAGPVRPRRSRKRTGRWIPYGIQRDALVVLLPCRIRQHVLRERSGRTAVSRWLVDRDCPDRLRIE